MAKLKITLIKSSIGSTKKQKAILESLGLRKLQHSVVHNDTPEIMGMVNKMGHLLKVEEV